MDRQAIIEELRNIIADYLKNQNLDLVDFILRPEGRDLVLKVFADKPEGGISLGECAALNRDLSRILDQEPLLQQGYILEVSSPGLDRPLQTKADFTRCINRRVRVFFNEPIEGRWEIEGAINRVADDSVFIDIEGRVIEIAIGKIRKAKQIINNI